MLSKISKITLLAFGLIIQVQPKTTYVVAGNWSIRHNFQVAQRNPAQEAPGTEAAVECKGDLFGVPELKREAAHYEALLEGPKLSGKWKHLDLADLPLAQARFLRALGDELGDLSRPDVIDYSGCDDVPCIVNKVYQSTSGIEGWVTYVWWLKMGNILTFKNKIYKQNQENSPGVYDSKSYPLSAYLYSVDELYAFWRMSHYLPAPYKSLTNLKEIQRIPRTAFLEGRGPDYCGLAWSSGYILLQDGCLSLGDFEPERRKDRGSFYHLVVHEMGHILDNFRSGQPDKYLYYSKQGSWLAEGKWSEVESVDPITKVVRREWVSGMLRENFVSGYAATNPTEHYAETVTFYRYNGDHSLKTVPASTYQFIKSDVYNSEEFTSPGMSVYFRKQVEKDLAPQVFNATLECYHTKADFTGPAMSASEVGTTLERNKLSCLYAQRERLMKEALADLKINDVEACSYFRKSEREVAYVAESRRWITSEFQAHIRKALEDEKYFEQLGSFYQQLAQGLAPVQMMTECYGEASEKECYETKVQEFVAQVVPESQANAERLRADLAMRFLESYAFAIVRAETIKTYQDFVSTQSWTLSESASELWGQCSIESASNEAAPVSGPFSVGSRWMASSQFNCINSQLIGALSAVVEDMGFNGESVTHEKEQQILRDLSLTIYVTELQRLFNLARAEELAILLSAKGDDQEFFQTMVGDFSWLKPFEKDVRKLCIVQGLTRFPAGVRYHSHDERVQLLAETCVKVSASAELKAFNRAHPELNEDFHVKQYLDEVKRVSDERGKICEERFPARSFLSKLRNRGRRSDCFVEGWSATQSRLLNRAKQEYGLALPAATLARMEQEGAKVRKRIKANLMGEILPDIGL